MGVTEINFYLGWVVSAGLGVVLRLLGLFVGRLGWRLGLPVDLLLRGRRRRVGPLVGLLRRLLGLVAGPGWLVSWLLFGWSRGFLVDGRRRFLVDLLGWRVGSPGFVLGHRPGLGTVAWPRGFPGWRSVNLPGWWRWLVGLSSGWRFGGRRRRRLRVFWLGRSCWRWGRWGRLLSVRLLWRRSIAGRFWCVDHVDGRGVV